MTDHRSMTTQGSTGYRAYKVRESPVGVCPGITCGYAEPHRHGSSCDKGCVCQGVGAVTRPLYEESVFTCDWGDCDREAVAERQSESARKSGHDLWLAVCSWHAGWDDYEGYENTA